MSKPVTDPDLLAELNGPVTDPALIEELEGAPASRKPPQMPTDTVSVFGDNIDVNRNYTGPGLAERIDNQNFGNRALYSMIRNGFFGVGREAIPPLEEPTDYRGKAADALGVGVATGADFALLAPAAALGAGFVPARVTGAIAGGLTKARVPAQLATQLAPGVLRTPATFAAQAQLSGGDPGRAALEGLGFSLLPGAPIVRNIVRNPIGAEAVNVAALTAMGKNKENTWGEAFGEAVPTALGLKIGAQSIGPIEQLGPESRLRRTSAELEKQQMLDERIRMAVEKELLASVAADSKSQEAARRAALMESTPVEPQVLQPSPADIARASAEAEAARLVAQNEAALAREVARREAHNAVAPESPGGMPTAPVGTSETVVRSRALEAEAEAQRIADEAPRREPVPAETIPARWDASTPGPIAPGTLVEQRGNPMPTTAEPAPIGDKPALVDQYGRPVRNRRRGTSADVPVNWSPSPEPIPDPTSRSRIVAPGQQPRRGDVQLGSGLGGGGSNWQFKELRGAIAEAGKRLGNALSTSDAKISENLLKAYTPGMKESEFLGMPGVRDQLMKAQDIDSVLSTVLEAGNNPQPPTTSPSGGRGRAPVQKPKPTSGKFSDLRQAASEPRPGSSMSKAVNGFLQGTEDVPTMARNLSEYGVVPNPERVKEIRAEVRAEIAQAKADAEASGTKVKQRDLFNGRTAKEEIEYRDLTERRADMVRYAEEQRALADSGEKASLDTNYYREMRKSQEYIWQAAGGGEAGSKNPLDAPMIRDTQDTRDITYRYYDRTGEKIDAAKDANRIKPGSKDDIAADKLIDAAKDTPLAEFAQTPDGRKILDGVKDEAAVISWAQYGIDTYERIRLDSNEIADVSGESPITKKPGYTGKYEKKPEWYQLIEKGKRSYRGPDRQPSVAPSLDEARTAKKSDPHAKRRTDREIDRDWGLYHTLHRYAAEEASVIGGRVGLKAAYENARILELNGFHNAAKLARNYAQSDFNRREFGPASILDRVFTEGGWGNVVGDVMKWNYDRVADAAFTLNLGWNLVVQPSSRGMVDASAGYGAGAKANWELATSRDFRKFVDDNVFSRRVKSRRGGSVSDVGRDESMVTGNDSGITKVKHKLQTVNEVIEREVDYYAAYAGMEHGKKLGLEGRELIDFMSDYIKKTQDVYNRQDRPALVRSKMFNVAFPFAGYSFNFASNLKEHGMLPGSKQGTYKAHGGNVSKVGYGVRLATAAAITNVFAQLVSGRDELYGPGSLPMYDTITGGGVSGGLLGPTTVGKNDVKMFKDAADGKYGEAIARGLRQRVPTGKVWSNLILAEEYSVPGHKPFAINEDEYMQALVYGVYSTGSGKAYLKTLEKRDPSLFERIMDTDGKKKKQEGVSARRQMPPPMDNGTRGRQPLPIKKMN